MKKVLLYLIGITVLLVVGFFCIGVFVPAVEYTTTVEINKPRNTTWKVLRERKDWIYGFKSYEQISGKPDEVGSRARVTLVRDGTELTFETELLDIKTPDMAATELKNDMLVHDATVSLTENNGKTTVVSHEKITGTNPFYRSLFALFGARSKSISARNFEGLKQTVETSED
jgi:hypothetical protein